MSGDSEHDIVADAYYEYWRDGVLQKCFKDHDKAVKHCKAEYRRSPQSSHLVYKARLERKAIFCMIP